MKTRVRAINNAKVRVGVRVGVRDTVMGRSRVMAKVRVKV